MKYIRFEFSGFLIFPDTVTHKHASKLINENPISAGRIHIREDKDLPLSCYGASETLKMASSPDDTEWLERQLLNH